MGTSVLAHLCTVNARQELGIAGRSAHDNECVGPVVSGRILAPEGSKFWMPRSHVTKVVVYITELLCPSGNIIQRSSVERYRRLPHFPRHRRTISRAPSGIEEAEHDTDVIRNNMHIFSSIGVHARDVLVKLLDGV